MSPPLKFVIAYGLVIVLTRFCYFLGTLIVELSLAGLFRKNLSSDAEF